MSWEKYILAKSLLIYTYHIIVLLLLLTFRSAHLNAKKVRTVQDVVNHQSDHNRSEIQRLSFFHNVVETNRVNNKM